MFSHPKMILSLSPDICIKIFTNLFDILTDLFIITHVSISAFFQNLFLINMNIRDQATSRSDPGDSSRLVLPRMSRQRVSPLQEAEEFVVKNQDKEGFSKIFINQEIGETHYYIRISAGG